MRKTIGLLLGAAAVYGAYRYSKLSASEKSAMKARGKEFLDKQLGDVAHMFGKKPVASNGAH